MNEVLEDRLNSIAERYGLKLNDYRYYGNADDSSGVIAEFVDPTSGLWNTFYKIDVDDESIEEQVHKWVDSCRTKEEKEEKPVDPLMEIARQMKIANSINMTVILYENAVFTMNDFKEAMANIANEMKKED